MEERREIDGMEKWKIGRKRGKIRVIFLNIYFK